MSNPSSSNRPRSATKPNRKQQISTNSSKVKYVPVSSPSPSAANSSSSAANSSNLNLSSASSVPAAAIATEEFIGRPLVPFFLPGSEQMIENTEQKLIVPADEYKRFNGKVAVRTFQDGYFSEPKEIVVKSGNQENNNGNVSNKKKKKDKKGNQESSVSQEIPSSSVKYANPSFFKSPDPSEIPLPKFLDGCDIVGDSLVPPAARSASPVHSRKIDNRYSSPVGQKMSLNAGVVFTPVKPIGESVQKVDSNSIPQYELISPAKLMSSASNPVAPSSVMPAAAPMPASRLA
jgi:hypothetical protein